MAHVNIAGERIDYTWSHAKQGNLTLVLVHGAGGSKLHWPALLRHKMAGIDVIALDLPGHGRSEGQPRHSIAAYSAFLLDFAVALSLPPFVLVGHSMGGAIAQETALRAPAQLQGLILVGTGASLPVNPALLRGLQEDYVGIVHKIAKWAYSRSTDPKLLEQYVQAMLSVPAQTIYDDFLACDQWSREEEIGQINLPTLILCGNEDRMTPLLQSEYLAAHIPGAKLSVIAGGGHMVALERPERLVAAINNFLRDGIKRAL